MKWKVWFYWSWIKNGKVRKPLLCGLWIRDPFYCLLNQAISAILLVRYMCYFIKFGFCTLPQIIPFWRWSVIIPKTASGSSHYLVVKVVKVIYEDLSNNGLSWFLILIQDCWHRVAILECGLATRHTFLYQDGNFFTV